MTSQVKCTTNRDAPKDATNAADRFLNSNVLSSELKWVPLGAQAERLALNAPHAVHADILLAKLRPGQEIEMRCHAFKGIGRDHAKFSPVATASYRLLPEIQLRRDFHGDDAQKLKESFSAGVIQLVKSEGDAGDLAVVVDARRDMCSRNIYRYPDLAKDVLMTRNKEHFICGLCHFGSESVCSFRREHRRTNGHRTGDRGVSGAGAQVRRAAQGHRQGEDGEGAMRREWKKSIVELLRCCTGNE